MANTSSVEKRMRQSRKAYARNVAAKSAIKSVVKSTRQSIERGDVEEARAGLLKAVSIIDRAAVRGIIHKNTAARRKSRLARRLNALQSSRA